MAKVYWHPVKIEGTWIQNGLQPPLLLLPTLQEMLRVYGLDDDNFNIENILKYDKNAVLKQFIPKSELPKEFSEFKLSDVKLPPQITLYVPIPWMINSPYLYKPCYEDEMCIKLKRSGPDRLRSIQFFQSVFYMDIEKRRKTDRGNVNIDDMLKDQLSIHHIDPRENYHFKETVDEYPFYAPVINRGIFSDKWGQNPFGINNQFYDNCRIELGFKSFCGIVSVGVIDSSYQFTTIGKKNGKPIVKLNKMINNKITIYDSLLWGADFEYKKGVTSFGPFLPSRQLLEDHIRVLSEGGGKNGSFKNHGWSFKLADSSLKRDSVYQWKMFNQ